MIWITEIRNIAPMSLADRYQWLFRKSPALSVSLDEDGYFLDASDAWLARFGYSREAIRELRPQDIGSEGNARRIEEEYLPRLRRSGRLDSVPVDLATKDGVHVDCLASAIVERGAEGDYLRTVVVYTEVGGEARLENVETHAWGDTVVMAMIERQYGSVEGRPNQDISLRVTHVYRRTGDGWYLVHRHADPMVESRSLDELMAYMQV